jgi:hypothetical protein
MLELSSWGIVELASASAMWDTTALASTSESWMVWEWKRDGGGSSSSTLYGGRGTPDPERRRLEGDGEWPSPSWVGDKEEELLDLILKLAIPLITLSALSWEVLAGFVLDGDSVTWIEGAGETSFARSGGVEHVCGSVPGIAEASRRFPKFPLRLGTSDTRRAVSGDGEPNGVNMVVLGVSSRSVCTASWCSIDCLGTSGLLGDDKGLFFSKVKLAGGELRSPKEKGMGETDLLW